MKIARSAAELPRPPGSRVLRPERRATGRRREADGTGPRARRRDPRLPDGPRRGRARPLLAQRLPLGRGAPRRARTPPRPAGPRPEPARRPRGRLLRRGRLRAQSSCRRRARRRYPSHRQRRSGRREMSVPKGKLPLPKLAEMKERGERIVMVTAYDAPGARFAEDAGIDVILVGDTAAMVVLGHEGTTVPVTMDEMIFLTKTVARAAYRPIVVGDMPFGSYQVSDEDAVRNAIRFVKEARADVVK